MTNQSLADTMLELGVKTYVDEAASATLARSIASSPTKDTQQPNQERLPRLGFLYESQGVSAYRRWNASHQPEDLKEAQQQFDGAFTCWRTTASLPNQDENTFRSQISAAGIDLLKDELREEPLDPDLTLAFRLSVAGLLANRAAETRLDLNRFTLQPKASFNNWQDRVSENIFISFTRLVRKAGGWEDISQALASINELREFQASYESQYLDNQGDAISQKIAAIDLVGLYHLAQVATIAGEYLRDGIGLTTTQVNTRIDRHHERAIIAFDAGQKPLLAHLADLLWVGCRELVQNSIWTHVNGLGESVRDFARLLTQIGRPNPVIELWPSQQEALRRNLLDPYRRAILVEMPTSAGKTLLAKFSIVQTRALNPTASIAYIVPTRALVNQITLDLRADFRGLSPAIRVEQAVPAFELDPTESKLLENKPDVLVTTPEKLDLLIKRDHPATRDLSLIIVDEAHNIADHTRGARLELLLGTIKRDRPGARFLLLSPFLPQNSEMASWLGEDRALAVSIGWKPRRKVVGALDIRNVKKAPTLFLDTLPASDNTDVRSGMQIPIDSGDSLKKRHRSISDITAATIGAMLWRGSILILCRGTGTAVTRANAISSEMPILAPTDEREAVCRYLDAEIGGKSSLVDNIRRGVAYHHSGLSHESRWLIESLIRKNDVKIVCGTTTLAQGMNFPITTVIVETLKKGERDLTYDDFWNIAGRAGRAMVDTVGIVAFPAPSKQKRNEYEEFLKGEAREISSQLAGLIDQVDEIGNTFNLAALRHWPQLAALLQFLAHAMRTSGSDVAADEVEDILRASLVYHQARKQGDEIVQRLLRLCRAYLFTIRGQKGTVTLADQTGFATPSVLTLLRTTRDDSEFTNRDNWDSDRLFGNDLGPLTKRIEAIAELPEMQLGLENRPPFNAERVASILRDWVVGETLSTMTKKYWQVETGTAEQHVADFSKYLFSTLIGRASWGIGALQSVSLAGNNQEDLGEIGYVPSMVYFGVKRKEAIWLRMAGVPRIVADNLALLWKSREEGEPNTYDDVRKWVSDLADSDWKQAIPSSASLTPTDMRILWKEFIG